MVNHEMKYVGRNSVELHVDAAGTFCIVDEGSSSDFVFFYL